MAVLLAAEIVLSRFLSISALTVKIGFSFVPIAIAARMMGPVPSTIIAALGDFMGALLFPMGPYFPGFTLTAAFRGFTSGKLLNKRADLPHITTAVLINEVVGSLFLNTLWLSMLYGNSFFVLLPTRLLQSGIMSLVQIATLMIIFGKLPRKIVGSVRG